MKNSSTLDWAAKLLLIFAGLNWGLVGVAGVDLVAMLFGGLPWLAKTIYILMGLSAVSWLYCVCKSK